MVVNELSAFQLVKFGLNLYVDFSGVVNLSTSGSDSHSALSKLGLDFFSWNYTSLNSINCPDCVGADEYSKGYIFLL